MKVQAASCGEGESVVVLGGDDRLGVPAGDAAGELGGEWHFGNAPDGDLSLLFLGDGFWVAVFAGLAFAVGGSSPLLEGEGEGLEAF